MNAKPTTETASKVVTTVWAVTAVRVDQGILFWLMEDHAQVISLKSEISQIKKRKADITKHVYHLKMSF